MVLRSLVAVGLVAAASLAHSVGACAATIVGGSDLLNAADAAQLESWLGLGLATFTNIFDKVTGSTSYDFHAAVDGKGPTVTLVEVGGSFGPGGSFAIATIGGYNPQSWNSSNTYNFSLGADPRDAFIFNLTNDTIFRQLALNSTPGDPGQYQTYNSADYGPTFGSGKDIGLDHFLLMSGYTQSNSYCPDGSTSCFAAATVLSSGVNLLSVGSIETFSVSVATTPIPASLPLLVSALAGMGFLARKRARLRNSSGA